MVLNLDDEFITIDQRMARRDRQLAPVAVEFDRAVSDFHLVYGQAFEIEIEGAQILGCFYADCDYAVDGVLVRINIQSGVIIRGVVAAITQIEVKRIINTACAGGILHI